MEELIFYGCIIASILGSGIMLTHLSLFDEITAFAKRLVFCLSLSDFLFALGLLLYVKPPISGMNQNRCVVQGMLTQMAVCSSFIWSTAIAFFMFMSLQLNTRIMKIFDRYQIVIYLLGFGLPIASSIVPFFEDAYNPTPPDAPITCSIRTPRDLIDQEAGLKMTLMLNLVLFYVPLVTSVLLSLCFIIAALWKIKSVTTREELLNKRKNIQVMFTYNLMIYPIILIICWLPSIMTFTYAFIEMIQGEGVHWGESFTIIQYSFCFLQGFLNSLAYYWNQSSLKRELEKLESDEQQPKLPRSTDTYVSFNPQQTGRISDSLDSLRNSIDDYIQS